MLLLIGKLCSYLQVHSCGLIAETLGSIYSCQGSQKSCFCQKKLARKNHQVTGVDIPCPEFPFMFTFTHQTSSAASTAKSPCKAFILAPLQVGTRAVAHLISSPPIPTPVTLLNWLPFKVLMMHQNILGASSSGIPKYLQLTRFPCL